MFVKVKVRNNRGGKGGNKAVVVGMVKGLLRSHKTEE